MKLTAVLMVAALAAGLVAQEPVKPAAQPATLARPAAMLRVAGGAPAGDAAELTEAQFLLRALAKAQREMFARSDAARARGESFNEMTEDPTPRYRPLFRALADKNDVDALLWCVQHTSPVRPDRSGEVDDHAAARAAFRKDLAALLERAKDRQLVSAASVAIGHGGETLTAAEAEQYCEAAIAKDAAAAATIITILAERMMDESDDASRTKATALFERALALETDAARKQRISGRLFALNNLRVGMKAPALSGTDLEGKTVSLADYKGRVTFLEFWGFW